MRQCVKSPMRLRYTRTARRLLVEANGLLLFPTTDLTVQVWLREHNRLCDVARANSPGLSEEELFELVQTVVIAKVQQVVLTEFLPSLGITQTDLETAQRFINTPDTSTEFSMAYRCALHLAYACIRRPVLISNSVPCYTSVRPVLCELARRPRSLLIISTV